MTHLVIELVLQIKQLRLFVFPSGPQAEDCLVGHRGASGRVGANLPGNPEALLRSGPAQGQLPQAGAACICARVSSRFLA